MNVKLVTSQLLANGQLHAPVDDELAQDKFKRRDFLIAVTNLRFLMLK